MSKSLSPEAFSKGMAMLWTAYGHQQQFPKAANGKPNSETAQGWYDLFCDARWDDDCFLWCCGRVVETEQYFSQPVAMLGKFRSQFVADRSDAEHKERAEHARDPIPVGELKTMLDGVFGTGWREEQHGLTDEQLAARKKELLEAAEKAGIE